MSVQSTLELIYTTSKGITDVLHPHTESMLWFSVEILQEAFCGSNLKGHTQKSTDDKTAYAFY